MKHIITQDVTREIVIDQDAHHLIVLHDVVNCTMQYRVTDGAVLHLEVVVVGDPAGVVDLSLPVTLEDDSSQAHVRVLGLSKSSKISINASMNIASGAQQTNGQLSMRGLLLDDGAAIAMTPWLCVASDDVSAGHGASIDRVDPRESFYLESRGLSRSDAQRMIWRGLLTDMVSSYDPWLADDQVWLESITGSLDE